MKNVKQVIKKIIQIVKGREIFAGIQEEIPAEWIGSRYGGFFTCLGAISGKSIIYSFGVGEDISFDTELLNRYRCSVFAFDPTPKAIEYVRGMDMPPGYHFFNYGIGVCDGNITFYLPENPDHVSCTIYKKNKSHVTSIDVPVKKFSTIIKELGHKHIDILKMDIEGTEYEILDDILSSNVTIGQMLIEFHHRMECIPGGGKKTKAAIQKLNKSGYRIIGLSDTKEEFTFLKME